MTTCPPRPTAVPVMSVDPSYSSARPGIVEMTVWAGDGLLQFIALPIERAEELVQGLQSCLRVYAEHTEGPR